MQAGDKGRRRRGKETRDYKNLIVISRYYAMTKSSTNQQRARRQCGASAWKRVVGTVWIQVGRGVSVAMGEGVYMLMTGLLSQVMLTAVCCVVFSSLLRCTCTYRPADLTMTMSEKLRVMLQERQCSEGHFTPLK